MELRGRYTKFPRVIALLPFAEWLSKQTETRRLAATLRKSDVAQSCWADLQQAADCIGALRELTADLERKQTIQSAAIENALLLNAVMLYARATCPTGQYGERGPIDVRAGLNDEQKADHKVLLDLRNQVIAHVYPRRRFAESIWHRHFLFAKETSAGWKPLGAVFRRQFDRATLDRVERAVNAARPIVREKFVGHCDRAAREFAEQRIPRHIVDKFMVDPLVIFGDAEAARMALSVDEADERRTGIFPKLNFEE